MPRRRVNWEDVPRVVASIEEVEHLPIADPHTPMDEFLTRELRQEILLALKSRKQKMLFLLMEYGFTPHEIAKTLGGLKLDTIQGYVYRVRYVARKVRFSGYTSP